jgi:hypothetical protein
MRNNEVDIVELRELHDLFQAMASAIREASLGGDPDVPVLLEESESDFIYALANTRINNGFDRRVPFLVGRALPKVLESSPCECPFSRLVLMSTASPAAPQAHQR